MVTTPRQIEIRDGKIALPEDMLEESGIGTSDGFVLVSLRESGEIVVRSYPSGTTGEKTQAESGALTSRNLWVKETPLSLAD